MVGLTATGLFGDAAKTARGMVSDSATRMAPMESALNERGREDLAVVTSIVETFNEVNRESVDIVEKMNADEVYFKLSI